VKIYKIIIALITISTMGMSVEPSYDNDITNTIRTRPITWAQPVLGSSLGNLYKIDDELYRSKQPTSKDIDTIKKIGIKSILSFREYHDDSDIFKKEDNITLYSIKIKTSKMSINDIKQALEIIKNAPKPILIHCWHGSDRTGVVTASYRIVEQKWSKKDAIDEFKNGGYGYHEKTYPQLEELLWNLNKDLLK
jgi:tyrosine-protein phosphatase SIW14